MENKERIKANYFLGTIGALLVGLIIAVLLAFANIYSENMFVLALTIIIPFFEFYGYKLLKGKINAKSPIILLIVTIINILIMSLLFIPMILLIKSNLSISISGIESLYGSRNIFLNIIEDCLFSLVFSILGVYIVSKILNRRILLNIKDINLFSKYIKEKQEFKEEAIKNLKPIFEKYNALQKESTITKEEILSDFQNEKGKDYFSFLKDLDIINKYKGKYYYRIDNENNIKISYSPVKILGIICLVAVLLVIIIFSFGTILAKETKEVYNDDVSFKIDATWELLEEYSEEIGWVYYKYLDTEETQGTHSYPATIGVTYTDTEPYESINELKTILEAGIYAYPIYDGANAEILTTKKGYDVVELTLEYDNITEIDYYIYKDGKIGIITAIVYSVEEEVLQEIVEYTEDILNSFEWNK